MITPGSKYFFGLTGLSLIAAILYMVLVNPSDLGAVALFGLASCGAMIGALALFTRDGDVYSDEEAVAANAVAGPASFWPIVLALGAAITLAGLATVSVVFILGISVLVGGGIEWAIHNWADGASSDHDFNRFARARAISALEYPGLAAVVHLFGNRCHGGHLFQNQPHAHPFFDLHRHHRLDPPHGRFGHPFG
jgi:hypothetical protein